MDIHINRKGEQHGPYPEATARQFLEEGKLLPADLAWHAGTDGWKPLSEVLGVAAHPPATPPPTPPQSATLAGSAEINSDKIQVTREGKPIGPYSRSQAKEYFFAGQLLPTDWGWHDGMDEWKPLYEVLGLPAPAPMGGAVSVGVGASNKKVDFDEGWAIRERGTNLVSVVLYVVSSLVLVLVLVGLIVSKEYKWIPLVILASMGGVILVTAYIWVIVRNFRESLFWGIAWLLGFGPILRLIFRRPESDLPGLHGCNDDPKYLAYIGFCTLLFAIVPYVQFNEEGSNLSAEERKLVGKFEHISADGDTERWTFLKDNVAEKYKNGKKEGTSYKWEIDGTIYVEHEDGSATGFSRPPIYTGAQKRAPIQEITIIFFIGIDGKKTDVGGGSVKKIFKRKY